MLSKSSLALGLAMMRQSLAQSRQPAFSHTLVFDLDQPTGQLLSTTLSSAMTTAFFLLCYPLSWLGLAQGSPALFAPARLDRAEWASICAPISLQLVSASP